MNDFLYETEEVNFGNKGKKLIVRGLSVQDIATLIKDHRAAIDQMFSLFDPEAGTKPELPAEFGWKLLEEFPDLASKLVALGADMPDREGEIKRLPVPVLLKALEAIYRLTIEDNGGLQDFLDRALRIVSATKKGMTL